ncbi:MAG: cell division protein ZapA [Betaproteobacteria bacterium]|nr:cell division protein ZapA [Betaproteobacteria bacterium]
MDATLLGASADQIYLRGFWSDYTKTVSGTTIVLTRSWETLTERVTVAAGEFALNDTLIFADGAVSSFAAKSALSIRLLEREYRLAVSDDEKQPLIDAAQRLDARMREIRDQGKIHAVDRIAIMAALEASLETVKISHETRRQLEQAQGQAYSEDLQAKLLVRLQALSQRISQALD